MPDSSTRPYLGQGNRRPHSVGTVLRRWCWNGVQALLFRPSPSFAHRWRIWLLQRFGADIPSPATVRVFPNVRIVYPWKLRLEAHTLIGPGTLIYNLAPITLCRGAQISRMAHLCAGSHDYRQWALPLDARPIVIGENAWLGAEVFVGPGVTIGELCVIGARSAVVKDQPPRMVCAGNPFRPVKERPEPI